MKHPLEYVTDSAKKPLFIFLLILSLVLIAWTFQLNKALTTGAAPFGIISFEDAYTIDAARTIMESWTDTRIISAGISLGMDFLFIAAYVLAIGLGCIMAAQVFLKTIKPFYTAGIFLSRIQIVAGILDCIENAMLIQLLLGSKLPFLPVVAFFCAWPKFVIAITGVLYMITGGVVFILSKIKK